MPITATISLQSPAEDEPRAELDDLVTARFSPTDVGNPISSVTATVDGVSATVTTVAVAGGVKDCSFPATFYLERTHTVEWTCTTADANPNVFAYDFTVRDADWDIEGTSLWADAGSWSCEQVGMVVAERSGGYPERVDVTVLTNLTSQAEGVELAVIEGLGAGYYALERVDMIVASIQEIGSALPLSIEVGPQSDSRLALSIVTSSDAVHNSLPLSIEVYSEQHRSALPLSLEVSLPAETRLPLSIEVGDPAESRLPLSIEIETALALPVPIEIRLINEDLADAEESMSASEADAAEGGTTPFVTPGFTP